MPMYRYVCEDGHEFEQRGGYDDDVVDCLQMELVPQTGAKYPCLAPAKRQAVYRDQSVIFSGPGWTKSIVPPPEPLPPSSAGESTDIHFEKLDEFASKQYDYDRNIRPEVKGGRDGGPA